MNQKLNSHSQLLLLLCCLLGTGCNDAPSISETDSPQLDKISQQESQSQVDVTTDTNSDPATSDQKSDSSSGDTLSEAQAYQPPFPERIDLFLPPKRGPKTHAVGRKEGESAVQLLGFSNVKDNRVLLSIDGYVYPVAEGESKSGIQVVSIKPPAVVLQRGRQVWQASLEN